MPDEIQIVLYESTCRARCPLYSPNKEKLFISFFLFFFLFCIRVYVFGLGVKKIYIYINAPPGVFKCVPQYRSCPWPRRCWFPGRHAGVKRGHTVVFHLTKRIPSKLTGVHIRAWKNRDGDFTNVKNNKSRFTY